MQWLLMPIAIGAGMLMVVQSACNSMLEKVLDRPVLVGVISLSVGVAVLLSIGIVLGQLSVAESQTARKAMLGVVPPCVGPPEGDRKWKIP